MVHYAVRKPFNFNADGVLARDSVEIVVAQRSELAKDEIPIDRRHDGLDYGRLEQTGVLPALDGGFADTGPGSRLVVTAMTITSRRSR